MQRQLEDAEILLLDLGATSEEVEAAIGPHGYARKMFPRGQRRTDCRRSDTGTAALHGAVRPFFSPIRWR
jgi:hypothetical protein